MTDFLQSISAGLNAHQETMANRNEIAAVITTLHEQMLAATSDTVGSKIADVPVSLTESMEFPSSTVGEAPAIIVYHMEYPDLRHRLCLMRVPNSGYPVVLKIGREKHSCGDRESLESAIATILALPSSGKAISDLMNYQPNGGDF